MIKNNDYVQYLFEDKKIVNNRIKTLIDEIYFKNNLYKMFINCIIDCPEHIYLKRANFYLESIAHEDISYRDINKTISSISNKKGFMSNPELKGIFSSSPDYIEKISAFFTDIILQLDKEEQWQH